MLVRFGFIGLVMAGLAVAFAYTGGWLTPDRLTPQTLITALSGGGDHPGFRTNHAKGLCFTGRFDSTGNAAQVSKAPLFAAGQTPVMGRFSIPGGMPFADDATAVARAMAVRFMPSNGKEWRTAMIDLPVFIVKTPQEFYEQVLAFAPDPATGKPNPDKIKNFVATHPETAAAFGIIKSGKPAPGFDTAQYNSLNAFRLIDDAGNARPVRWSLVPLQQASDEPAPVTQDKNFMFDEVIAKIAKAPLRWRIDLTLGQPGDPTNDATLPWPATREKIDAGTVTIDHVEGEDHGACRDINFDPLVLPPGIAPSDDPLLNARSAAYARSFTKRSGETKQPSAITTTDSGKGQTP